MTIAFRHPHRSSGTPAHDLGNNGERLPAFEQPCDGSVPKPSKRTRGSLHEGKACASIASIMCHVREVTAPDPTWLISSDRTQSARPDFVDIGRRQMTLATLSARAERVAQESKNVASKLARAAITAKHRRDLFIAVNVVVGVVAFAAGYVAPIKVFVGESGNEVISLLAALILIFNGILTPFLGADTYERFSEYSFYVRGFGEALLNTLADDSLPEDVRRARVSELLTMATKNLDDVLAKWPWATS